MTQINPFAGAIAQTPQTQRLAAAERDAQVRRTVEKQKNAGYSDQPVDEFIESADAVSAVGDDDAHQDPRQRKRPKTPHSRATPPSDGEKSALDVRA
jgi:hypothetical protein